ncbi:uncharacterized protein LOC143235564 [Tachypleus tridentatus]|uniref:uncharacterized protein LOC143235564 n=1 Tax=Tachypleus tridentatus TaxID=6853 RepID=UPI003FD5BC34
MLGPTDVDLRNKMVAYNNAGLKQGDIAKRLDVSRQTVNRVLRRRALTESVSLSRPTGRPRTTTARDDCRILTIARRNRTMSSRSIASALRAQQLIWISLQTLNRRLVEAGYKARNLNGQLDIATTDCSGLSDTVI